jgi:hypothetical protein
MAQSQTFLPGQVIKHYGVYRCSCGGHELYGISGRVFPRPSCGAAAWEMQRRLRDEPQF